MKPTMIFPTVLIALDLAAALMYYLAGNYKQMIYWISAATLTATVTY